MKHKSIAVLTLGSTLALAAAGAVALAGDGDGKHHGRMHGGPGKHLFAEMDADKDGNVTRDEAKSASDRLFQKLDLNRDGSITQAEAQEGMKVLAQERAEQRFAAKDTNKDGKLSAEESRMPAEAFARVDADKDGFLTKEELAQKFQPRDGGPRAKFGARQFERMDTDKNGTVTKAEAVAAAETRFAKIDANGDGVITRDELKGSMRHKRGGKPPAAAEPKQ